MPYPTSLDVSAGQPTASAHYNTLRADALRLGASEADGVNIGSLFGRYSDGITLILLGTNRVRIPATPTAPASIVIDGVPLQSINFVDLPLSSVPTGTANTFYLFALRSAGSTSFTLDVNTSATESTGRRKIASFFWDGSQIMAGSICTSEQDFLTVLLSYVDPTVCEGRLTVASGEPVPSTAVSGGTAYFTPYLGSRVALYQPSLDTWRLHTFAELSLSMVGQAVNTYDIFIYDAGSSGLVLERVIWSNSKVRATGLAVQNGVYVKAGSPGHRYLGTVYLQTVGTINDSDVARCIWNHYNRVPRRFLWRTTTGSWAETTQGWRPLENANSCVYFVIGLDECLVNLTAIVTAKVNSGAGVCMLGIDLDANDSSNCQATSFTSAGAQIPLVATYCGYPTAGMHYLQGLEGGNAVSPNLVYYGDNSIAGLASGLTGFLDG